MARKVRIQYPGATYHVMNRGDRREAIFEDDEDRERLLRTLGEACEKTQWQVHAYCLMRNHFHLVVETPQPNLVAGMKWLLGEALRRLGWTEADLQARRKGEPRKVELARQLREQTTMPLAWIAGRLKMGSRGHLAWLLQHRHPGPRIGATHQCSLEI
jgi:REP element-mobilizing transposase RayT